MREGCLCTDAGKEGEDLRLFQAGADGVLQEPAALPHVQVQNVRRARQTRRATAAWETRRAEEEEKGGVEIKSMR